ncbi:hypothetical protein D3C80_1503070 [compost metagenome]
MLSVHPCVVRVAHRQTLEFDARVLGFGQVIGDFACLFGLVAFEQRVVERGAVFKTVTGISIRRRQHLSIQLGRGFRLPLVQVGRRHPAQCIGRNLHAFGEQLLILGDHIGGARTGLERAHAVNAPTHDIVVSGWIG